MSSDDEYEPSEDSSVSSEGSVYDGFTDVERTIVDDNKLICLFRKINIYLSSK